MSEQQAKDPASLARRKIEILCFERCGTTRWPDSTSIENAIRSAYAAQAKRIADLEEAAGSLAQEFADGPCWCWESTRAKWLKDDVRHQSDCRKMKEALAGSKT